jgi:hypothetical protein
MIGLNKADRKELQALIDAGHEANEALEDALWRFNDVVAIEWEKVTVAIAAVNAAAAKVAQRIEDHVQDWQSEMQDRSDRWAESDAGVEAQELCDEWTNVSLDPIEIDEPEGVEIELPDYESIPDMHGVTT